MEKILVIEDDDSIRSELKTLLRANGYQPVDCQPCDLVLLDINHFCPAGAGRSGLKNPVRPC